MTSLPLTALVTLLVVLLMFFTGLNIGRAKARWDIKAPAVTGHELFERAFRIQMNTLEGAALMLPSSVAVCRIYRRLGSGHNGSHMGHRPHLVCHRLPEGSSQAGRRFRPRDADLYRPLAWGASGLQIMCSNPGAEPRSSRERASMSLE